MRPARTFFWAIATPTVVAVAVVGAGVSPANAAPSAPATHAASMTIPMNLSGRFDPAVARAHGYTVARDAGGRLYSTKPGYVLKHTADGIPFAEPRTASPDSSGGDTVYGNCGSSSIKFNAIGGLSAQVVTGYKIKLPSVELYWKVQVIDSRGDGIVDANPDGSGRGATWSTTFYTHGNAVGEASAEVTAGSFAEMTNGQFCYSESPEDYTRITD